VVKPLTATQVPKGGEGLTVVSLLRKIVNALNAVPSVKGIELNLERAVQRAI
jgi:hypothetical protein